MQHRDSQPRQRSVPQLQRRCHRQWGARTGRPVLRSQFARLAIAAVIGCLALVVTDLGADDVDLMTIPIRCPAVAVPRLSLRAGGPTVRCTGGTSETTSTLFCGDLFTAVGDGPAITEHDIVGPAIAAEDIFGATCLTPTTGATIRSLADLHPHTLGLMHGPSYTGDAYHALQDLAAAYDHRLEDQGLHFTNPHAPGVDRTR